MNRASAPTVSAAVGQRIRRCRLERNLTQTELARQIGIQQSDLSRMEQGEYRVPLDTLFKILRTFEVSFGEFFGDLSQGRLTERESTLLQSFRSLSRAAQQEVLDYVEFKLAKETEADD